LASSSDLVVFWTVVLTRLLLPLFIPRFPLPAVVACLVVDGVDQSIFQKFTTINLEGYQGYDKSLDIYYLTVAYISTMRNWTHLAAFRVSRFLYHYRLVGVVAFELTQLRPLLLIFPNTFEYFFIFYEAVRMRWDPRRMSKRLVVGAAAFIWIFIKLPQEWWIHIAQLDATDFIKETIYGVPTTATWAETFTARPALTIGIVAAAVALLALAWWVVTKKCPPADHALRAAADPLPADMDEQAERLQRLGAARFLSTSLFEKVVIVSLVSVIFAQVLPDVNATNLQLIVSVAVIVGVNTLLSHFLASRGIGWESVVREFVVMLVANIGFVWAIVVLGPRAGAEIDRSNTMFFLLLLTLIVTLYDRYRPVFDARFAEARQVG